MPPGPALPQPSAAVPGPAGGGAAEEKMAGGARRAAPASLPPRRDLTGTRSGGGATEGGSGGGGRWLGGGAVNQRPPARAAPAVRNLQAVGVARRLLRPVGAAGSGAGERVSGGGRRAVAAVPRGCRRAEGAGLMSLP